MHPDYIYHKIGHSIPGRIHRVIEPQHLKILRGKEIVDVGCSYGYTTHDLSHEFDTLVTGIDINELRINQAKEANYRGKFIVRDGYFLDRYFTANSQDSIIMMANLYIAMDQLSDSKLVKILNRSKKVLRERGHLCIGSDENYLIFGKEQGNLELLVDHQGPICILDKQRRLERLAGLC